MATNAKKNFSLQVCEKILIEMSKQHHCRFDFKLGFIKCIDKVKWSMTSSAKGTSWRWTKEYFFFFSQTDDVTISDV